MEQLDYKALGGRIRKARQAKKMTQDQLAEACGLSTAHIGHIERGTRIPSLDTLFQIVCELKVSADYLLLDSTQAPQQVLAGIWAGLAGREDGQVKKFVSTVRVLADKIDEL